MPKVKRHYFPKNRSGDCGENAVQSVLSMYGKGTNIKIATKDGTSPKKITSTLKKKGIKAKAKDSVAFKSIKPKSIAWYPRDDHYVAIEKNNGKEVIVNDSSAKGTKKMSQKQFERVWHEKGSKRGYVIETKKK